MKLKEVIEQLEEMKLQYASWEVHIEYLRENNREEEAQEQAKELADLGKKIQEMENAEVTYR